MRTEELSDLLHEATGGQPFVPSIDLALTRATQLQRRRRVAMLGSAFALSAVVGGSGLLVAQELAQPDRVQGQYAQAGGQADIRIEAASGSDVDVSCALTIVISASTPDRILVPCGADYFKGRAGEVPALTRQDKVVIDGRSRFITSGTAPAGTVAVTALDDDGKKLTAVLRRPGFAEVVAFVFITDDNLVKDITYELPNGRIGPSNTVSS